MSVGLSEVDQKLLQKLLMSPLTQSFESLILPAQDEMNKLWVMQVYQPFNTNLSKKYPFNSSATLQATSNEISQILGENGSIARYVKEYLDPLVIRRGYTLTSKTWKDLGISLNPQFVMNFQSYVAPSNGMATGALNQASSTPAATAQSNFQFYPIENPKFLSYTIDIDGQRMLYENGIQQWVNFVWPNAVELFEKHYSILYDGLKGVSTTHLSRRHSQNISPSVMTFPLEFKSLKPALKTFIGTLFEDNPYQFKPVFRGFYFTSALQEGIIESPMTEQIAQDFLLQKGLDNENGIPTRSVSQNHGYFLKGLFSDIILKDKNLVKQHINPSRKRQRYIAFVAALFGVAIILSLWVWSYRNNQQLIADVQADLDKVVLLEKQSGQELSTQLSALLILQERMQQLDQFEEDRPLKLGFGLYQGDELQEKLKTEYLKGVEQIVLIPTQQNIAQYLQRVKSNEEKLRTNHANVELTPVAKTQQYLEPNDANPQDAYNALKAYLMMGNTQYMDASHLSDQVTRFWRSWLDNNRGQMPRGEMIQKAEQILSYSMTLVGDPKFPVLSSDSLVVDQTRQVLLSVIRGMPARDRVYNELKMRAAVRYPALTIKQMLGDANQNAILWSEYVEQAIDEVAKRPTDTKDWVLNSTQSDDLSFSGSPDQIRKQLTELYKKEYIAEWRKFLGAIHYAKAKDYGQQASFVQVLGEPENSPIRSVFDRVAKETSWDNPVVMAELAAPQTGFVAWFKRKVLRRDETQIDAKVMNQAQGPISKEFQTMA